ncbi:E3 ubiquitin-protein ligase sina-like [Phlebotomus argentipes]|uniref:E3 ubiquitin-protein ligase sina-like n=1 Tax=Phlebotomus argentipes TaxID=94469 RepID=UPI002892B5EF|nr:E3 ubiquitin-protein ligase sina-like [Phlebotomus argentipes]
MGATESTQSQSNSTFVDRVFSCPVCYEKYTSHIMQCQSGHSVCQNCHGRLNQCPQCCARYNGTRNYTLEDIMTELSQLQCSPEDAVKDVSDAATIRKMARPASQIINNVPDANAVTGNASSSQAAQVTPPQVTSSPGNSERTVCRMQYCRMTMPLNSLENHLLTRHDSNVRRLTATAYLSKSYFTLDRLCVGHRFALLTEFGIFFLIIRVEKLNTRDIRMTAWIQGACSNAEASLFYSYLQVQINNMKATYHDIVHGSRSTVAQIEDARECLSLIVKADSYCNFHMQGFVSLNRSQTDAPRQKYTLTEFVRVDDSTSDDDSY